MAQSPGSQDPPPTLEYGRPRPPVSARRVFAGLFGVLAAIGVLPSLFLGMALALRAMFVDGHSVHVSEDWTKAGAAFGLSLVCAIAAFRWCRTAGRGDASDCGQSRR